MGKERTKTEFVTKPAKRHITEFDNQWTAIFNKILFYYRSQNRLIEGNIIQQLEAISSTARNLKLLLFLHKIKSSFKLQWTRFKHKFKNPTAHLKKYAISDKELEKIFAIGDDQIVVYANKNMGFTVMDSNTIL